MLTSDKICPHSHCRIQNGPVHSHIAWCIIACSACALLSCKQNSRHYAKCYNKYLSNSAARLSFLLTLFSSWRVRKKCKILQRIWPLSLKRWLAARGDYPLVSTVDLLEVRDCRVVCSSTPAALKRSLSPWCSFTFLSSCAAFYFILLF